MQDRVKMIRRELGMSQEAFGKALGIQKSSVSKLESGENNPSERTMKLIVREFHVNERWLKTGEGSMFAAPSHEDDLRRISETMQQGGAFAQSLLRRLASLSPKQWEALEAFVSMLKVSGEDGDHD